MYHDNMLHVATTRRAGVKGERQLRQSSGTHQPRVRQIRSARQAEALWTQTPAGMAARISFIAGRPDFVGGLESR